VKKEGQIMYFSNSRPLKILAKNPELFKNYYLFWGMQIAYMKFVGKKRRPEKYAGKYVQDMEHGNDSLKQAIQSGKPFMAGRFGSNELSLTVFSHLRKQNLLKDRKKLPHRLVIENCGFFPASEDAVEQFGDLMIESMKQCDIFCVWYNICEDYFVQRYGKSDITLIHRKVLDFWNFDQSWTGALKDKKVLVIHPLDELIQKQYEHRKEIFTNESYLPAFELRTLKAVQTIAGTEDPRFSTWFDALQYMYEEAMKIDFDIALIGCGAYGYPLAAKLKESGKQAVHMGGVIQILFGIRGNRWDNDAEALLMRYVNEAWMKPDVKDIPQNAEQVEGSCYW